MHRDARLGGQPVDRMADRDAGAGHHEPAAADDALQLLLVGLGHELGTQRGGVAPALVGGIVLDHDDRLPLAAQIPRHSPAGRPEPDHEDATARPFPSYAGLPLPPWARKSV